MAKYSLVFGKSVEKDLRLIPRNDQIRILKKIAELADNPRPPHSKKLSGQERYRLRQGNCRILYEIEDTVLLIIVVKVGHRQSIYR